MDTNNFKIWMLVDDSSIRHEIQEFSYLKNIRKIVIFNFNRSLESFKMILCCLDPFLYRMDKLISKKVKLEYLYKLAKKCFFEDFETRKGIPRHVWFGLNLYIIWSVNWQSISSMFLLKCKLKIYLCYERSDDSISRLFY